MLHLFFLIQFLFFFRMEFRCFCSKLWGSHILTEFFLFLFPFLFGWCTIYCYNIFISTAILSQYHCYVYFYSIVVSLSLLPQWYKWMWLLLHRVHHPYQSDERKMVLAISFASIMIAAIVLFFALYYLCIDALCGYTQGLRHTALNYQPILLNFSSSFYFSFVTYFTLGYGDLIPYGNWFHALVFLECLISLLNTGIVIIYVYNLLFKQP